MSVKKWLSSRAYRDGHRDGVEEGKAFVRLRPPIVIHTQDGRVLHCEAVIEELRRCGWLLISSRDL